MALLASCGIIKSYPPYHYRLTVEVDTPQGLRTGSTVIEIRLGEVKSTLGGASNEISGEAASVDLPGGQTLFALLRSDDSVDWAKNAMEQVTPPPPNDGSPPDQAVARLYAAVKANTGLNVLKRHLPPLFARSDPPRSGYPMLVRFGDIKDPKTVAKVDPDDLAGSFGPGFALRRMTVQLTDDPVTSGIEKRLPKPPYSRSFIYQGEESPALNLYKGKKVPEKIDTESFVQGIAK